MDRASDYGSEGREFESLRAHQKTDMKTLCIEYPESIPATLNMSPDSFEEEARIALAVKLFEMGRVTSGQAAALAGVSRVAFLMSCKRYGTPSVTWDSEELEAEFRELGL
jgi:predicted HTH domain antitoxin